MVGCPAFVSGCLRHRQWKMEACLTRFCRQHLARVLSDEQGGTQALLRGLTGSQPVSTAHAVQSADWYGVEDVLLIHRQ
jgi:hypothetical protein